MELHQLRYMTAVAEEGTFCKAANRCHISQPSLSHQVIKLEDELGVKLFLRTKKTAVLTPAGEVFFQRARSILEQVRQTKQEIESFANLDRGTISIGVLPTIAPYFFAMALTEFRQSYPQIEVRVIENTTHHLLRALETGRLDLIVLADPLPSNRMIREELFTEELIVVLPKSFTLPNSPFIDRNKLETSKFIVLHEEHCLSKQCLEACTRAQIHPQLVLEASQIETILTLVNSGIGISLVPEMALQRNHPWQIQQRKLRPAAHRTVVMAYRPDQEKNGIISKFGNILKRLASV
jgi:LysR family transcriptional regulator, hydrogen peroxide-inducible genes activator